MGKSSQKVSVCEVNNPLIIADLIKETVPEFVPLKKGTTKTHRTPFKIKRKKVSLKKSDSEDSYESGKPSKAGKKNLKNKAKPKKKVSSQELNPPESSQKRSGDYSQRGLFYFTQKAKHRFFENYNILTSGADVNTESDSTPGIGVKSASA